MTPVGMRTQMGDALRLGKARDLGKEGIMNTKRKLIILTIAAALSACAAPQEKPQTPPTASDTAPPVVKAPPPEQEPESGQGVVILPLDQSQASPAESVPFAALEVASAPEMNMEEKAPVPAPAMEAAPAPMAKAIPSKPRTVVADRAPREFTITVEKKTPNHPNYGRGHEIGFVVDGVQGEELVLTRGVTYVFHVRTNVQHDFYFTTSPRGRGAGTVADGVTGQFTYIGDVTFTPTAATPDVMYYECRNHPFMGGKIHVANAGDKVKIGGETVMVQQQPQQQRAVTAAQVKQKLNFAEMMINSSPATKRVMASGNAEAKKFLAQAKQQIDSAHAALSAGDNGGAMQAANEAVHLLSEVGRLVPADAGQDFKPHYAELLDQIRGFDKSYRKNVEKGIKPKSGKELDRAKFDGLMKEADGLAAKDDYEGAVKRLEDASDMMTAALGALLESRTVVYDKNFATPKEEYEYELSRYASYEELIPIAIEQRHPAQRTVDMMDKLAARAKEIHGEAVALAAKGDHKQGIMALQAATNKLRQALRLAGVQ